MKLTLTGYLIIIVLLLGGVVTWQQRSLSVLRKEHKETIRFAKAEELKATVYENKLGRETAKVQVLELSNRNLRLLRESDRIEFVKQFEGVKKNLRNIEQVLQAEVAFNRDWMLLNRDTVIMINDGTRRAITFTHRDEFNTITGITYGDTTRLQMNITVPLQGAVIWKRKKILGIGLGRKQYEAHLTSLNPNVTITGLELIRVSRKP